MINLIRENIYKLSALIAIFFIFVFEDNNYALNGFYYIDGVCHGSAFFFFDQVQGVSILFYLIWPFFAVSEAFDKRAVVIFLLERTIEIVFLSALVTSGLIFLSCYGFFEQPDTVVVVQDGLIRIDSYALVSKLIILILSLFFLFLAYTYFRRTNTFIVLEFPACASFSILCLANMSFIHDFFLFFLVMEAVAFVTILFIILNFSKLSVEGAIKYFIMNSLAAGLFLMGCLMIYSVCMSTNFLVLHELISIKFLLNGDKFSSPNLILGVGAIFITIAIVFKLGGYPFNFYVPDVYEASPTFVIFFLSVLVKSAFFLYLIRLLAHVFFDLNFFCSIFLAVSAVSSIIVGCFGGLLQDNIKRLFGFASVNQLGFLLAGVSVSNYFSFRVTLLYFFIYILVASIFLFILSSTYNISAGRSIKYISELKSLPALKESVSSAIPLHIIFLLSVFSMCGLPPLAGFFAKYFLMFEILREGSFSMIFFILLGSALSSFYYLKLIFGLVSYGDKEQSECGDSYFFEQGYETPKSGAFFLFREYPLVWVMDVGAALIFYMPVIFWAYDVFSVVDFFLVSVYV